MATSIHIPAQPAVSISGCPACLAPNHTVFCAEPQDLEYFVARNVAARILKCTNCHALYQSPFPNSAETNSFYAPDYQNYAGSKVPFLSDMLAKQNAAVAEKFSARFGKDAAVLDFGCGSGSFLKALSAQGMGQLSGYDVALRLDSEFDGKMTIYNDLNVLKNSGITFDVIRMNHVIEHLADLDAVMTTLKELLKENGILVGQTPNAAHYTAKLFGKNWGPLHYPYHTVLFSRDSIEKAAPRWGMHLTSTAPCLMPTGWAMSAENIFKGVIKSKTRGRTALYSLFILAAAPFAVLDYLRNDTAIFDFELVRNRA